MRPSVGPDKLVNYELFPLGTGWSGFVGGSISYIGARDFDFNTVPAPRIRLPSYNSIALHAGANYGDLTVEVFVKNPVNKQGISSISPETINPVGSPFAPRTRRHARSACLPASFSKSIHPMGSALKRAAQCKGQHHGTRPTSRVRSRSAWPRVGKTTAGAGTADRRLPRNRDSSAACWP
jgi:hypothetical protein